MPVTPDMLAYEQGYKRGVIDTLVNGATWLVAVCTGIVAGTRMLTWFARKAGRR